METTTALLLAALVTVVFAAPTPDSIEAAHRVEDYDLRRRLNAVEADAAEEGDEATVGKLDRPHILMVLADDYGWANLGRHMRDSTSEDPRKYGVYTPSLDALIDTGVLLDRHYAFRICSPSRSSLQSGRLAAHVNIFNTGVTVHNATDPVSGYAGIPVNMTGIAEKLRDAGYRTHATGKWDAGMATVAHTPAGRGYESWLGYFQHSNDYWTKSSAIEATGQVDNCLSQFKDFFVTNSTFNGPVYEQDYITGNCQYWPMCKDTPYCPCYKEQIFKNMTLSAIENYNKDEEETHPLFLFHAFGLLHTPLEVPAWYMNEIERVTTANGGSFETENQQTYAAMVLYLDFTVSEIVAKLIERDMWRNTLMVFISDNGGPIYVPGSANNFPHRGGKYSDFEGGVRTNAFVAGGWLPDDTRGTVHDGIVSICDWYATFASLASTTVTDYKAEKANIWLREKGLPLLPPVDGVDQWDAIIHNRNGRPEALAISEKAVIKYTHGGLYKLVTQVQPYATWTAPTYPNCSTYCPPLPFYTVSGPVFQDFKVWTTQINASYTQRGRERIYWQHNCGYAGCLYRVDTDPTEHYDLAGVQGYEAVHAELLGELQKANTTLFTPYRGDPQFSACEMGVKNIGYYGPFVSLPEWGMNLTSWYGPRPEPTFAQKTDFDLLLAILKPYNDNNGTLLTRAFELGFPTFLKSCISARIDSCKSSPTCYEGYCIGNLTITEILESIIANIPNYGATEQENEKVQQIVLNGLQNYAAVNREAAAVARTVS